MFLLICEDCRNGYKALKLNTNLYIYTYIHRQLTITILCKDYGLAFSHNILCTSGGSCILMSAGCYSKSSRQASTGRKPQKKYFFTINFFFFYKKPRLGVELGPYCKPTHYLLQNGVLHLHIIYTVSTP